MYTWKSSILKLPLVSYTVISAWWGWIFLEVRWWAWVPSTSHAIPSCSMALRILIDEQQKTVDTDILSWCNCKFSIYCREFIRPEILSLILKKGIHIIFIFSTQRPEWRWEHCFSSLRRLQCFDNQSNTGKIVNFILFI